jgi:3-mercaptopyruvate sulfurtransferase SseA
MRNFLILLAITLLAIVIACAKPNAEANLTASNAAPLPSMSPADDAPRISLEDAKKDFDAGTAVFVDSRAPEAYKIEHIKGAINIPTADKIKEGLKSIPPDKKIIVYCS